MWIVILFVIVLVGTIIKECCSGNNTNTCGELKLIDDDPVYVPDNTNQEDTFVIHIDDFAPYAAYASDELRRIKMSAMLRGKKYIQIPIDAFEQAKDEFNRRRILDAMLSTTCELNNNGIAYEKNGDIDKAIECYEKNIKLGYPAAHSYHRLMVLYRRRKEYANEQRVINRAIEVYEQANTALDDVEKWKQRLIKSQYLESKTQKH